MDYLAKESSNTKWMLLKIAVYRQRLSLSEVLSLVKITPAKMLHCLNFSQPCCLRKLVQSMALV